MTAALQGKEVETFPPPAYVGETVNPKPTFTPTPTPTKSTETPSETPTVVPTTAADDPAADDATGPAVDAARCSRHRPTPSIISPPPGLTG